MIKLLYINFGLSYKLNLHAKLWLWKMVGIGWLAWAQADGAATRDVS